MEYTSCIRVRGVPILPPLMTEDLRSEMSYYKKLALSVEERLSRRRSTLGSLGTPKLSRKSSKTSFRTEETLSDDETLTRSTDLLKYLGTTTESSETSPEGKPRVPTSLDVIPISLEPLMKSKSSDELQTIGSKATQKTEEPKTLVRQGSYTLDTPSPLLLAHIENKREDYIPSKSRNSQDARSQRRWSLSNGKRDWTLKNGKINGSLDSLDIHSKKLPKLGIKGIERSKSSTEVKNRNFDLKNSNFGGKNCPKNFSLKKPDSDVKNQNGKNQNSSSKNSPEKKFKNSNNGNFPQKIDKTFDKNQNFEFDTSEIGPKKGKKKDFITSNGNGNCQNLNFDICQSDIDRNFDLSEKIEKKGGSLDNLVNSNFGGNDRMTKSLDTSDFEAGTSERLLGVFREIQRTHDRQMADLIERQQKEQIFMQQAFEKQQLMLLEQIDRTFPGVSILELVKRVGEGRRAKEWRNDEFSSSFDSDGSVSINFGDRGSPEGARDKSVNRQLFPRETRRVGGDTRFYEQRHVHAATVINAHVRGFLVRRMMKSFQIISLKNTYREALHCMLKLTVDAPLELPELNFHKRLQLQCDAASMNIVEIFSQSPAKRMEIIAHDRELRKARSDRPTSARSSISFATQRTLARKKLKELGIYQLPESTQSTSRTRCQTWTSNNREKKSPGIVYRGIKRSTSAGAVRKPWR